MASDSSQTPELLSMPLEVRHHIFEYVALRDTKPEKLLRYWFERKEVEEKTAELVAKHPETATPRVVYEGDQFEAEEWETDEEEWETDEEEEGDGEEDSDEEGDGEEDVGEEDDEDDEGEDEEEVDEEEEDADEQNDGVVDESEEQDAEMADRNGAAVPAAALSTAPADAQGPTAADGANEEDGQMDDEENDEDEDQDGDEDADGDSDEDMVDEEEDEDIAAGAVQPPPAPVVTAHRKWRHIPKFMRITHCPPPAALFLASKQLNAEAKNWFYDVAVLHIDATGSFAHTSFFEEAFSQITAAAFSPMADIRKVDVVFVWDTTWLRSDQAGYAAAIFPALLRQRAIFVAGILAQAPHLSEVVIHWHDSAEDEEAVDLMNDVLKGFLSLKATVRVEPHYIAAAAKPYRKSIAGKRRVEFQRILNNGLDRLF
ncbi:uncharacterized protein M421DRAFT_67745 [Didymella exigua CBS 183.55]|uniref:Uncharacterized protein n=1 Tax=Didymella exigua CBS 183.55 TaxID=1150837 RepID=A0A6A5RGL5_9PLEO|nr:uncharacterized protein M421DRAFT_67745 [Didymella exigua CBS 183.55]KAF1926410.1 hypothetical protein M421DRAFT_67745 [Didymella exigua CBS 183.55]